MDRVYGVLLDVKSIKSGFFSESNAFKKWLQGIISLIHHNIIP